VLKTTLKGLDYMTNTIKVSKIPQDSINRRSPIVGIGV
jgi:hypothetical protein